MASKRRRTREEIRQVVREFRRSGLSDLEFAKKAGIQPQHLRRWNLREKTTEGNAGLVRVKLRSSAAEAASSIGDDRVEVVLRNGRVLRVPQNLEQTRLLELIEMLEKQC